MVGPRGQSPRVPTAITRCAKSVSAITSFHRAEVTKNLRGRSKCALIAHPSNPVLEQQLETTSIGSPILAEFNDCDDPNKEYYTNNGCSCQGLVRDSIRHVVPARLRPCAAKFRIQVPLPSRGARERTRTSTPSPAQALNLLCMPIPPRGLWKHYIRRAPSCQLDKNPLQSF